MKVLVFGASGGTGRALHHWRGTEAHMGKYQHGPALSYGNIKGWISRGDLADFMLKQLEDDRYIRQAPRVSY